VLTWADEFQASFASLPLSDPPDPLVTLAYRRRSRADRTPQEGEMGSGFKAAHRSVVARYSDSIQLSPVDFVSRISGPKSENLD
jgi:hypothetical protein